MNPRKTLSPNVLALLVLVLAVLAGISAGLFLSGGPDTAHAWVITAWCNPDGTVSGTTTVPWRRYEQTFTVYVEDRVPFQGWQAIPGSDQVVTVPERTTSVDFGPLDVSNARPGAVKFRVAQTATWQKSNTFDPCLIPTPTPTPDIDIKPDSDPNSINPQSQGTIPVAILSAPDFDAPSEVDKDSLTFGRTGDEHSLAKCPKSAEDVNRDGLLDQVCHFRTQDTGFQCGDREGILRGQTVHSIPIEGRDSVRIVPCRWLRASQ